MRVLGLLGRWLLVPVSAVAIVITVIAAGRGSVALADGRCPVTSMVGGACVASWHTSVVEAAIYAGVILVALGLVIVPAMIAPALKRTVAVTGFVLVAGAVGAVYYLTSWGELLAPLLAAIASGGAALGWMWKRGVTHG